MRKTLLIALMAAACLSGCKKSPTPPPTSAHANDAVDLRLKELAGSGANDCGRLDIRAVDTQMTGASSCATKAAQEKHPFYVAYDMPGMSTGVAGNAEGKLFAVELQGAGPGAQLQSGPCPGELRIAKSGRMTCFAPGTMSLTPSNGDPHAGIAMNGAGAKPQGMVPQPMMPSPFPSKPATKK